MRRYIWQDPKWPAFHVDHRSLAPTLDEARKRQFTFLGALFMAPRAVHSSDIEGERLDRSAVRSSVARRLGAQHAAIRVDDRTERVVDVTLDATRDYDTTLTRKRLCRRQAGTRLRRQKVCRS